MKFRISKLLLLALCAGTFSFMSCSDDDNLMNSKDFLTQTWQLEEYRLNGVDQTDEVLISNYSETYEEDGDYTRSYIRNNGDTVSETGHWEFDDAKSEIQVSDVSSINEFSEEHSTLSSSRYNVILLTETMLHYEYENGGDLHHFRFSR